MASVRIVTLCSDHFVLVFGKSSDDTSIWVGQKLYKTTVMNLFQRFTVLSLVTYIMSLHYVTLYFTSTVNVLPLDRLRQEPVAFARSISSW